jgi:DNA mismatch repair ATPase MutS
MITKFYKNGKVFDVNTSEVVFTFGDCQTCFRSKKGNFWTLNEDTLAVELTTEQEVMDLFLTYQVDSEDIHEYLPKLKDYMSTLEEI